jgi:hypothetical protein
MSEAFKVFCSYSARDEAFRIELEKHLSLMRREKLVDSWHFRKITAGDEWKNTIDTRLEAADVILLLISSDFLHSDYCWDVEMKRALRRHLRGDARVIPLIVRDCDWEGAPFAKLQALPKDGRPITGWRPRDAAWKNVAQGLRLALKELVRSIEPSKKNLVRSAGKGKQEVQPIKSTLSRARKTAATRKPKPTIEQLHAADWVGRQHEKDRGLLLTVVTGDEYEPTRDWTRLRRGEVLFTKKQRDGGVDVIDATGRTLGRLQNLSPLWYDDFIDALDLCYSSESLAVRFVKRGPIEQRGKHLYAWFTVRVLSKVVIKTRGVCIPA